jgi:flagellar biosynthetic protein FliO
MSDSFNGVQALVSLVGVLLLIPFSLWVVKKSNWGQRSSNGRMKLLETLVIGPKERLVLVKVGQQELVLGVSGQQISLIAPLGASGVSQTSFAQQLEQLQHPVDLANRQAA